MPTSRPSTSRMPSSRSTASRSTISATGTRRRSSPASTTGTRTPQRLRSPPSSGSCAFSTRSCRTSPRRSGRTCRPGSQGSSSPPGPSPTTVSRPTSACSTACRKRPASFAEALYSSSSRATRSGSSRQWSSPSVSRPTATRRPSVSGCGRRSRGPKGCWRTSASSRTHRRTSWRASARSSSATGASSMHSVADNEAWIEGLSPWPEEFGLGRMRQLLAELGEPQESFQAIHVVGTNGKTTTTRLLAALIAAEGESVGSYTSPHVTAWSERIQVTGKAADLEAALGRERQAAEAFGAAQFEALAAAAFAEFATARVEVAVVEAGLGGRLDATNVLNAPVVVLTNVDLEHTDVLGATREEIAREKLAVIRPGATAVLGEPEWGGLAREAGAASVFVTGRSNLALAVAAAESYLGRQVDPGPAEDISVPGRLERVVEAPLEIWDGAHNLGGVGYVLARLPARRYVVVASILEDQDVDGMLAALSPLGDTFVATVSSNARALPAEELAVKAERFFARVETVSVPREALEHARELAGLEGAVLVTGSLYLLADLAAVRPQAPVP